MKFFKLFFCATFFICASINSAYAQYCTNTGSSAGAPLTETSDCLTQPDTQQVTFYKIALCTSAPTAPTSSAAIGTSSCTTIFSSASGAVASIQKNLTVNLSGTYTKPAAGTYQYLYMEIDPVMKVQKTAYFTGSRSNTDLSSSGTKCWSLVQTTYAYSSGTSPVATTCGANGATATGLGLTSIVNNSLDGGSGFVTSRTFSAMSPAPSSVVAYLVSNAYKVPTNPGVNTPVPGGKIVAYTQLSSPLVLSPTNAALVTGVNIGYENSYGTLVSMGSSTMPGDVGSIGVFSGGPLSAYVISLTYGQTSTP